MMSNKEIESTIESLQEWEDLAKQATEMVESLKDSLKAELAERNVEELAVDTHIIRYTTVLSNRFDTTAFKKVMPDVYKAYTKQVTSRRFSVGA